MSASKPHSEPDTVEALRLAHLIVSGDVDAWCDQDSDKLAAHALLRLEEQFGVLQEKARRFLVATGGPPEKIEDVGKARRELVDALHASYPAKSQVDWNAMKHPDLRNSSNQESKL